MKKSACIVSGLILGILGFAKAAVELIPHGIDESRRVTFVKDEISGTPNQLKVTFDLKGPEVDSAVKFGDLKLDEAVDDLGTNLIPKPNEFDTSKKFAEFSNAFFRKDALEQHRKADAPQIEINLALPKRAATKIARLRGTVSLAQAGTVKTIELANLKEMTGTKLDVPAAAGLTITVSMKPDESKQIRAIDLDIKGNEDALDSIEVVDAAGKKVSNGDMSAESPDGLHESIDLAKPVDATMKLVVKVGLDRKITKVPFDLKDIVLP